jgi:hypothetical protein
MALWSAGAVRRRRDSEHQQLGPIYIEPRLAAEVARQTKESCLDAPAIDICMWLIVVCRLLGKFEVVAAAAHQKGSEQENLPGLHRLLTPAARDKFAPTTLIDIRMRPLSRTVLVLRAGRTPLHT